MMNHVYFWAIYAIWGLGGSDPNHEYQLCHCLDDKQGKLQIVEATLSSPRRLPKTNRIP